MEGKRDAHWAFKDMHMVTASKQKSQQVINSSCLENKFELHTEKGHDQMCTCSNQDILKDDGWSVNTEECGQVVHYPHKYKWKSFY